MFAYTLAFVHEFITAYLPFVLAYLSAMIIVVIMSVFGKDGPTIVEGEPCVEPVLSSKLGPMSWTLPFLFLLAAFNQRSKSTVGCFDLSSPYFFVTSFSYDSYDKLIKFQ